MKSSISGSVAWCKRCKPCKGCKRCKPRKGCNRARATAQQVAPAPLAPLAPLAPGLRVLFRAAAGPRRGYGHLLRCRSLARALGVRPLVCVRGRHASAEVALGLGCDVVFGSATLLRRLDIDVLVVDDPVEAAAAVWIAAAQRQGIAVASIHDLGIGCATADLLIDGSITQSIRSAKRRVASGPEFAIVDPDLANAAVPANRRKNVVVSLGGGPRAKIACDIAGEIARRAPDVRVRVVGGFVSPHPPKASASAPRNVTWVGPSINLARELGRALIAVVGGGVSLYEACALGTPAVGVAVVRGQRPTVGGFVARGAALGQPRHRLIPRRVADAALALLEQKRLRQVIARRARRLIDGQGARRAAVAIARLVEES